MTNPNPLALLAKPQKKDNKEDGGEAPCFSTQDLNSLLPFDVRAEQLTKLGFKPYAKVRAGYWWLLADAQKVIDSLVCEAYANVLGLSAPAAPTTPVVAVVAPPPPPPPAPAPVELAQASQDMQATRAPTTVAVLMDWQHNGAIEVYASAGDAAATIADLSPAELAQAIQGLPMKGLKVVTAPVLTHWQQRPAAAEEREIARECFPAADIEIPEDAVAEAFDTGEEKGLRVQAWLKLIDDGT